MLAKLSNSQLPGPWQEIDAVYRRRFHACSNPLTRPKMPLAQFFRGQPVYPPAKDRILSGIMRKAGAVMMCTCISCGRPGKLRNTDDERAVLCASCFAQLRLPQEIRSLLKDLSEAGTPPEPVASAMWHRHELSPRVMAVIPPLLWRHTTMPNQLTLHYLAGSDLLAIQEWLARLAELVEESSLAREARA